MDELHFEWDEEKASINLAKHRVSFLTAAAIFANKTIERVDDREDCGELRLIALGGSIWMFIGSSMSKREEWVIRIISVQRASRNEREFYYRQTFT
jgi:uncharacterized protein